MQLPQGGQGEYGDAATAANYATITARAAAAITANIAYLAIGTPTQAQTNAQVVTLTKECTALIKVLVGQLSDTTGT